MGRFGESICKHVMRASGLNYIPLCDIAGGAPMAVGAEKTILPDLDVFGGDVQAYLDAKVKKQSVRWKKGGQVRHGINRRNYESYKTMGLLQRKQCGLFLVELLDDVGNWSGSLLSESFLGLGEPLSGFSSESHMVYWPRNRFALVGSYSPDDLSDIANGLKQVNMAALLKTAFVAPPRTCASHNDRSLWIDEAQRDSRGWIRTVCKACGAFIGYRSPT